MPQAHGVSNVCADIGQSFANTIIDDPRVAAAMLGILIKGLGPERVIWGTDAVWAGSPQWQIEGLRRLEIPEEMQQARSEEHTSELQSLMRISYAVFCLKKK